MDKNNARGFTLIELLIVTSIIILMSGTSLAIFSSFREEKVLGNQVILFTSAIDLAKNKASAGDVSLCSSSATAHVAGYSVIVNSVTYPNRIAILPGCDTVATPIKYVIPSSVIYIPATFTLNFDSQNYQGEEVTIVLKNSLTSKCKFVLISNTGLVTNGDTPCP